VSAQVRALLIGMIGPALQAAGVAWDLLEHGVLARDQIGRLTFGHVIGGPAHLMIAVGFALSLICIPLALQVAIARQEELESQEAVPTVPSGSMAPEAAE
jgi:hypothetical protein